jgi:hypothetical protein
MNILRVLLIGLLTLFTSLRSAVVPSVNSSIPSQVVQPQPSSPAPNADSSRNWSGYAAVNGTYTGVSATWAIPNITGSANNYGVDATWVGIGGVNTHDLIQVGTQEAVGRNGPVSYNTFFEILPYPSQSLPVDIKGGDSVTVSLNQKSPDLWQISLKDNSSGKSISINQQYASSMSSADWIEEAPSSIRRIMPLANFGTVQFRNVSAILDGKQVNLAQANAQAIAMGRYDQVLATASVPGNDGASFSVTRTNTALDQYPQAGINFYDGFGGRPSRHYHDDFGIMEQIEFPPN